MQPVNKDNFNEFKDLEIAKFMINKSYPDDFVKHVAELIMWANEQGFNDNLVYNVRIKATANLMSTNTHEKIVTVLCDIMNKDS